MIDREAVWVATFAAKFAELHTRGWASDIHDTWCDVAKGAADDAVAALERSQRLIEWNGGKWVKGKAGAL